MAVVKRRPVPKTTDKIEGKSSEPTTWKAEEEDVNSNEPRERMRCPRISDLKTKQNEVEGREDVVTINNLEQEEGNQEQSNYELDMFQPSVSKTTRRGNFKAGAMSIVKSNCGKRIMISKEVMDKLNNPSKIVISFSDERIAIGQYLPNNNNQLDLKMVGKKGIIYSASLVTEIAEKYKLDFSTRTSMTFTEVNYVESNGYTVAIIKIK